MGTPFPEEAYVLAIGKLAYAVAYLEWTVLGDLPHIGGVPPDLELPRLVGLPTGQIGKRLSNPAVLQTVADLRLRSWLQLAGESLKTAAGVRNRILHARPATVDGKQRLYRWDPKREEAFSIEGDILARSLATIERLVADLGAQRYLDLGTA